MLTNEANIRAALIRKTFTNKQKAVPSRVRVAAVQRTILGCLLLITSLATASLGQGFLLVEPDSEAQHRLPRPVPLETTDVTFSYSVTKLTIDARIIEGVSSIDLTQTFENQSKQVIRSRCTMPVPYDATVSGLTFLVDGNEIEGRMLPKNEANQIFESYVRKNLDPALLQWSGNGVLQTDVFPIPPGEKREVTIRYSRVVDRTDGMLDFHLPLAAGQYSQKPLESLDVRVVIDAGSSIGNIYSPSHSVSIVQRDTSAEVTLHEQNYIPKLDFRLMVADGNGDLHANLIAYKPTDEDGYFALILHPGFEPQTHSEPKDIVLVLDCSGSMRGEKIAQARNALIYVLNNLSEQDRFGIVTYNHRVDMFQKELKSTNQEHRKAAERFVNRIGASSSTNIEGGLNAAMDLLKDSNRPSFIIHLSDGLPTLGLKDDRKITAQITNRNKRRTRIFNFGVGFDVNSRLMERLSNSCYGKAVYVTPEENIEESVSRLYDRIGQDAFRDVRWDVVHSKPNRSVDIKDVYPNSLPDLFVGDRAVVFGRYSGAGKSKLKISGTLAGKEIEFEQSIDLRKKKTGTENKFIAALWANRRAATIVDEIDLEGKTDDLIEELVELSRRYGILTPYTAFLAEEPLDRLFVGHGGVTTRDPPAQWGTHGGRGGFRGAGWGSNGFVADQELDDNSVDDSVAPFGQGVINRAGGGIGGSWTHQEQFSSSRRSVAQPAVSGVTGFMLRSNNNRLSESSSMANSVETDVTLEPQYIDMLMRGTSEHPKNASAKNGQQHTTHTLPTCVRIGDRSFYLRLREPNLAGSKTDSPTDKIKFEFHDSIIEMDNELPNLEEVERFSKQYFEIIRRNVDLLGPLLKYEIPILVELDGQRFRIL